MNSAGNKGTEVITDHSTSTTASASHLRDFRLAPLDVFVLSVMFLEAAVLLRLFLAP
jgi:hypothetical protein